MVVGGLAVGAGVGVGLYFALRNSCVLYPGECYVLKYRTTAGAGLQVHDERSGYTYWYDGTNTIHSYGGERLPGVCPSVVAQGATGVLGPVAGVSPIPAAQKCAQYNATTGECTYAEFNPVCVPFVQPTNPRVHAPCAQWSADGKTCECGAFKYVGVPPASRSDTPVTPQEFPGVLVAKGPAPVFTPGFVVDAHTMKLRTSATGEPVAVCSRSLETVNALFDGAAWTSVKVPSSAPLNVYELFGLLKRLGVFRVKQ